MGFPTYIPSRLAAISHEIRTPLTVITGYAKILLAQERDPEKKAWCQSILSSSRHLEQLINDILEVSKASSETFKTELAPTDIRREIQEVCELLRLKAEEKGIRFGYIPSDNQPLIIQTDPIRVKQILFNLIGNAIKFTNEGHVIVRDCLLDSSKIPPQQQLQITVEDTGGGIGEKDSNKIFSPFFQSQIDPAKNVEGTGLGLSISRSLAQALGGDVKLESTNAEGSTFNITIDASLSPPEEKSQKAEADTYAPRSETSDPMRLQGMEILIADDAEEILAILTHVLEGQGARVTAFMDGAESFQILSHRVFDAAILDIQMPGMDGFQIAKKLRSNHYSGPLLALTAHQVDSKQNLYKSAGFNCEMSKPINFEKLLAQLEQFKRDPSEVQGAPIDLLKKPRVLLVEDDDDLGLLTSLYLNESGYESTIVQTLNHAKKELWKQRFDFILLDLILPDGRGTDLLKDYASSPNRNTPVIVASGNVSEKELNIPEISRIFRKPYDLQQLISYLKEAS